MKKIILMIALSAIVLILGILSSFFQRKPVDPNVTNQNVPTPTSVVVGKTNQPNEPFIIPGNDPEYKSSVAKIAKEEAVLLNHEEIVGYLLDVLPYKGNNVQIIFNYDTAKFVVVIPQNKEKEGNAEFDEFLKQNNIEDRSWIRKNLLVIRYE